jgi:cytosol alanyl aminopeptidase
MLVDDLAGAVRRDELPVDKLLPLAPVIAVDPDDKVARSASSAAPIPMNGLDDAMYQAARRWYHKTFSARARQLGWHRRPNDSEELHELRRSIVPLVAYDDPALTAEATKLADQWLTTRSGIPDDLVWAILSTAARHGNAALFERYLAMAKEPRDRSEKQRMLGQLGSFDDPALSEKALALVLGHDFDLRDTLGILFRVLTRRETRELGIGFITAHVDELLARMREDEVAALLGGLAGLFCDPAHKDQMAALARPRAPRFGGAENYVTRGLEEADQCIAYTRRVLPALHRVLDAK